jgi:hypothetical protein
MDSSQTRHNIIDLWKVVWKACKGAVYEVLDWTEFIQLMAHSRYLWVPEEEGNFLIKQLLPS